MSTAPAYRNSKAEEYARWRRRDHANIEAMQNLVIASIAEESGVGMPQNVRLLVSGLQGAHGGGEVAYEPFERSYLSVGAQLHFTGTPDAIEARVRRWVNDLLAWQADALFELFSVVKGGDILGYRLDGTPIRQKTRFIDYLKPKADEAVQRARKSELWKQHPGKALAAQVEWLKKELPRLKPKGDGADMPKEVRTQPAGEYAEKRTAAIAKALEDTADGIAERGSDSDFWLEKMEVLIRKMRDSRRKTAPARRSWITLDDEEDGGQAAAGGGNAAYKGDESAPTGEPPVEELGDTDVTQSEAESLEKQAENEPSMKAWGLAFASQGVGVFPLEPRDKVPLGKLVPNGCKNATTDEAVISKWFDAEPEANLGVAMGGRLRLLGVDMDSRSGGDASLYDLVEVHGDDWLDTFTVKTGDNGRHFYSRLPEGVEVHRAKLAPGIDIKAEGGYLVAPPSIQPKTGRRFEVEKNTYIAEAPPWLVEELTRKPNEQPAVVIDFQKRRERQPPGGPTITSGERNVRLFKVGATCGGRAKCLTPRDSTRNYWT